jgi:hypothetical protein
MVLYHLSIFSLNKEKSDHMNFYANLPKEYKEKVILFKENVPSLVGTHAAPSLLQTALACCF